MLPDVWEKEIINIRGQVDWVHETSEQLIKDFTMLDIPLVFQPFHAEPYADLFTQAEAVIKDLYEKEPHTFLNLLYRVDLSEAILHQLLHQLPPQEFYHRLTELILKREFMKVVYRHQYSH